MAQENLLTDLAVKTEINLYYDLFIPENAQKDAPLLVAVHAGWRFEGLIGLGYAAILIVCNFTPVPRYAYRVGAPRGGFWQELLNSDADLYGGSGHGNFGGLETAPIPSHGRMQSLNLTLPPLGVVVLAYERPRALPPPT